MHIIRYILLLVINLHSYIIDIDPWNFHCHNIIAF